jgi:multidrug efflux system membrane fusion protein
MSESGKVNVRFGRPCQRRQHRLTAPLDLMIRGQAGRTIDWSTEGLRFRAGEPGEFSVGEVVRLSLSVPFQEFSVSTEVEARIVRAEASSGDVALQFVDLPARARELLKYFSENLVRGEMAPIDGTIMRLDLPVTPPRPEAPKAPAPISGQAPRDTRPWLVGSTYLTTGVVLAGALLYTLYRTVFLVPAEQAMLYAPTADLIVPEDGTVSAVYVSEGDNVKLGERLMTIASPRLDQLLSEARIREREAVIAQRRAAAMAETERRTLIPYRDIASDQLAAAEARLSSAERQAAMLERRLERIAPLVAEGYVSAQEADQTETDLQRARASVIEAQAQLRIAGAAQQAAQSGKYFTSNRLEGRLPELQAELVAARAQVELAGTRLKELERQADRLTLRAPVAGRVRQVSVIAGSAVTGGRPAISLMSDEPPQVYAVVPADKLAKIAIGHRANVFVPALSRQVGAEVVSVEPRIWALPENVRRMLGDPSEGGLVVLALAFEEQETGTLYPGLPVSVEMGNEAAQHGVRWVSNAIGVTKSQAATTPPARTGAFAPAGDCARAGCRR